MSHKQMIDIALVLTFLMISSLVPSLAQERDETVETPVYTGQVAVDLTNLEVFVTNRRGIPISGLEPEDFIVLQDGEPAEITNFFEIRNGEILIQDLGHQEDGDQHPEPDHEKRQAAMEPETRMNLVVYIDMLFSRSTAMRIALAEVEEFLRRNLREQDRVMVVLFTGSVHVLTSLEDSQEASFDAIERMRSAVSHGDMIAAEVDHILDIMATRTSEKLSQELIDGFTEDRISSGAEEVHLLTRRAMRGLHATVAMLAAGCQGRKAILMISGGAPANPFKRLGQDLAAGIIGPNSSIKASPRGLSSIVSLANATGVTFYTVTASGQQLTNPTNVITPDRSGWSMYGRNRTDRFRELSFEDEVDSSNTLQMLAAGTGGINIAKATPKTLSVIANDLDSYYSIGIRTVEGAEEGQSLKVDIRRRDAMVRHRRWHQVLRMRDRLAGRTLAALEVQADDNSIGLSCEPSVRARSDDSGLIVPLTLRFEASKVGLVPKGDDWIGSVKLFLVARQRNGDLSPLKELTVPLRLSAAALQEENLRRFALRSELPLEPGQVTVAVTAYDEVSGAASTITTELKLASSGVVTSDAIRPGVTIRGGGEDSPPA